MPLVKGKLQNSSRGGLTRTFDYVTDDALAVVSAPDYFNDAWSELGGANKAPLAIIQVISGESTPLAATLDTLLVTQIVDPADDKTIAVLTTPATS